MIGVNLTKRLIAIQREIRARKSATKLSYGQLIYPDSVPSVSYTGLCRNTPANPAAVWIVTFTRTDGINETPLVDFPWSFSLAKGFWQDIIDAGWIVSVTGRDVHAAEENYFNEMPEEYGSNYVKWRIFLTPYEWYFNSSDGTTVTLNVQAISMVPGTLTITRAV